MIDTSQEELRIKQAREAIDVLFGGSQYERVSTPTNKYTRVYRFTKPPPSTELPLHFCVLARCDWLAGTVKIFVGTTVNGRDTEFGCLIQDEPLAESAVSDVMKRLLAVMDTEPDRGDNLNEVLPLTQQNGIYGLRIE